MFPAGSAYIWNTHKKGVMLDEPNPFRTEFAGDDGEIPSGDDAAAAAKHIPAEAGETAGGSATAVDNGDRLETTPELIPPIPMPLVTDQPETEPIPPADTGTRMAPLPFTPPETVDDLPPARQNPPAVAVEPAEPEYELPR